MATKNEMRAVLKNKFLCQDKFTNDIENLVQNSQIIMMLIPDAAQGEVYKKIDKHSLHSIEMGYLKLKNIQEKIRKPQFYGGKISTYSDIFPNYKSKGKTYYSINEIPLKETSELSLKEKKKIKAYRLKFISK